LRDEKERNKNENERNTASWKNRFSNARQLAKPRSGLAKRMGRKSIVSSSIKVEAGVKN